jgi:hypothetical protein
MLKCETCSHWQPLDRLASYAATCALGCYPGRVAFDMGCDKHSQQAPTMPPPQDQSNARGIVQMWQARP